MARDRAGGHLDTVVGPDTCVKGNIKVDGSMRIDGTIEGNVDLTGSLLTGPSSQLKGDVRCREAVVAGRIEGNILAAGGVELQTGARVFGDISCKGIVIHHGAVFNGSCSMRSSDDQTGEDKVWLCRDEEAVGKEGSGNAS